MKLSIIKKTKGAPRNKRSAPSIAKGEANVGERLDAILRTIEEDIVVGKMRPGERLDERTLAQRFNVSRTPIREVLVRMSSLGIVELKRNQGAFVAEISSGRLIGMLEVMGELKVLAARQSARRMSIEERQRIIGLRDEMAACFADPTAAVTLMQCQRRIEDTTGKVPNTIRVSLGLASDFADVYRFLTFAQKYRDR